MRKPRSWATWSVTYGLGIVLLLAGAVQAADVSGAWANGDTLIQSSTSCFAAVDDPDERDPLPVNSGDNATFHYNVSWADTRSASSRSANHTFHLRGEWGLTKHADAWHNVTTTGNESGSDAISVSVLADAEYVIDLLWEVSLTSGVACSASDSATANVTLDL